MGKASASAKAIWQAPLHYRGLQFIMNSVAPSDHPLPTRKIKFSINLNLTEEAKIDLSWWTLLDCGSMMVSSLLPPVPTMTIQSDASSVVKGRIFEPHQLSGTASSIFGAPILSKAEAQHYHSAKDGQPINCDLYKQNGQDPFSGLVLAISLWNWSL